MSASIIFDKSLIAPCGMNCGTCVAFLRERNKCYGCRADNPWKPKTRVMCIIKNCTLLEKTISKFCYECIEFPCRRLKQLDKRYKTKYYTSFIDNLLKIKEEGLIKFLVFESERRSCPNCGSVISVHRENCMTCNIDLNKKSPL